MSGLTLIQQLLPNLLEGLKVTLMVFSLTLVLSLPLGVLVAILRRSKLAIVRTIFRAYIYIMRGTPLLLQLMFIYFGLPILGITIERFPAAILAFVLNYTAYFGEIFRGGMGAIDEGQFEALTVLGIPKFKGYFTVILPQVVKIVLPSVTNETITLVKDTSLIYVLGITELLRVGQTAANANASLIPFLAVGVVYLLVCAIVSIVLSKSERNLQKWG